MNKGYINRLIGQTNNLPATPSGARARQLAETLRNGENTPQQTNNAVIELRNILDMFQEETEAHNSRVLIGQLIARTPEYRLAVEAAKSTDIRLTQILEGE